MTDLERRQDRAPVPSGWDYAPAPESRDIVTLEERYGLYIGGELVEPKSGEHFPTISPASEEVLAEVAQAGPEDVDLAVQAARDAYDNGWSTISPAERAKYLFRIARILQERSREFAVLESLNGGKPIKESRDVDVPLAAAHFFYYAGWADKLEYAFPHRRPRPVGVAGQIIPWNFPLLMLSWKIAPALAAGNTVILKPAETTPLSALLFADVLRQAELPPGVVNIVTGDGRAGAELVKHPDVDKIAFTGSTEVGKAIQRELAGTGKRLTLELGGKAANIIFDDAALDQAVEGIVNGIYFNQGHVCCAGSRLLVQESIYEPVIEKLKRRLTTLRVGDPLDKNTDVGCDQLEAAAREDRGARPERGRGRRGDLPAAVPSAGEGLLVRPDRVHQRRAELPDRAGGDLRARALGTDLPDSGRGGREGEQHAVWALRRSVDREGLTNPFDGEPARSRRRLGKHLQPLRSDLAVRRLQGVRIRPRRRPPRARAVRGPRGVGGSRMTRLPVRKTYKLFVGGDFPRSESGRTYEAQGQNVARASRKDVRDAVRAARGAFGKWRGMTAYNRGQVLYRIAEMMESRTEELAELSSGRKEVEAAVDRWVWYAGWADKYAQILGTSNPVAAPYFNFTIPEPTGVVGIVAPDEPALDGLIGRLAPVIVGGNTAVVLASESSPLAAIELAEALATSDVPGGVVNILTGFKAELAPWLAGHMDVNAIDVGGADGEIPELERLAADNVKRVVRGRADRQSPYEIAAFLELKTVWHPIGV